MFGFGKNDRSDERSKNIARGKVIIKVLDNLQPQLGGFIEFHDLAGIIERDAYIAGYILAKISALVDYHINADGLSFQEEFGRIRSTVVLKLFGEAQTPTVTGAFKSHIAENTPNYLDGKFKGNLIVAYATGLKDISSDSGYKQAIARHRATKHKVEDMIAPTQDSDHWDAVAGLEWDWFFKNMERY